MLKGALQVQIQFFGGMKLISLSFLRVMPLTYATQLEMHIKQALVTKEKSGNYNYSSLSAALSLLPKRVSTLVF